MKQWFSYFAACLCLPFHVCILVPFFVWRDSIISPTEEGLSPKHLDWQQIFGTFKSLFSIMSNLLYISEARHLQIFFHSFCFVYFKDLEIVQFQNRRPNNMKGKTAIKLQNSNQNSCLISWIQRSKLIFSISRLLATFIFKMVANGKFRSPKIVVSLAQDTSCYLHEGATAERCVRK